MKDGELMLKWNNISIRRQFLLLEGLLLIMILLLLVIANLYLYKQAEQNFRRYIGDSVEQLNVRLSGYVDQMSRYMLSLAYDPVVQDFMASPTIIDRVEKRQLLSRRLSQATNLVDGVFSIVIKPEKGTPAIHDMQISFDYINTFPEPKNNKTTFFGMSSYAYTANSSRTIVNYLLSGIKAYSVRQYSDANTFLGTVFVLFDSNKLGSTLGLSRNQGQTDYYIMDHASKVVYSTRSASGQEFKDFDVTTIALGKVRILNLKDNQYYIYREFNKDIGMYILSITPSAYVISNVIDVVKIEVVILISLILISMIIFVLLQKSAVKPLWIMAKYADNIQVNQGRRNSPLKLHGNCEVEALAKDFNNMMDSIDRMNAQLLEAAIYKKQSEIVMLQNQINPHFLYNTLETIKGMAIGIGSNEITQMTGALARVNRYSIKAPEFVTLNEEVAMLVDYISIQKVRFGDRFDVKMDIASDSKLCLIPKMLLQPLVENAIQHGLEHIKTDGLLIIKSIICDADLVIEIKDNGVGMNPVLLDELQKELDKQGDPLSHNKGEIKIGVINVHGRTKRYFGDKYGLVIQSKPGLGMSTAIHLPIRREGNV